MRAEPGKTANLNCYQTTSRNCPVIESFFVSGSSKIIAFQNCHKLPSYTEMEDTTEREKRRDVHSCRAYTLRHLQNQCLSTDAPVRI